MQCVHYKHGDMRLVQMTRVPDAWAESISLLATAACPSQSRS